MIGGISASGGVRAPKKRSKPRGTTSVAFDGTNDNVSISDFTFATTGDFSVSAWFKYSDDDRNEGIFNQSADRPNTITFMKDVLDRIKFSATVSGSSIINLLTNANATPNTNRWYHVVVCVDRSSASDSKIYVDGVAATMGTQTIADTTTSIDLAADITVGLTGTTYLKGRMKEITFYNKTLNVKEVSMIYKNNAAQRLEKSRLGKNMLCHLTMGDRDDTSATTVTDLSGNSRNGTLTNGASFVTDSPS
tara:strand:+ start:563 stop:1309 length:747 start_codon:yes stop_codon:yes gene_type:complete